MVRRAVAVSLIVGSVLLSLDGISTMLITWAQLLPTDASFEVGDRASIEQAVIRAAHGAREDMRAVYAPRVFLLSGSLIAVSVALAFRLLKSDHLAKRSSFAAIPPNQMVQTGDASYRSWSSQDVGRASDTY